MTFHIDNHTKHRQLVKSHAAAEARAKRPATHNSNKWAFQSELVSTSVMELSTTKLQRYLNFMVHSDVFCGCHPVFFFLAGKRQGGILYSQAAHPPPNALVLP